MIRQVDDILSLQHFTYEIGSKSSYLVQDFAGGLYHYTDLNGLIGIITKHDLWLTHSRFSNDENEMNDGYRIAKEVLKTKREQAITDDYKSYTIRVEEYLDKPSQGVYICCFCEKNNLLSQWRSYGENGTGVSLGFNPLGFTQFTGPDLPPDSYGLMRLWKVYYKDATKKDIIEQALDLIPQMHQGESDDYIAQRVAEAIHFFLPTFKDPDFEEENERRLIFTPSVNCQVKPLYRNRRQMLVPYFSLNDLLKSMIPDLRLPLISLTVGPGSRKEINRESVEMLLENHGYEGVKVDVSDTPYRG
ncbi:MAG: DUF2971 domain-containing protein [Bacteroidetes bacterium]|nr:DUF2971 domain-containing protein [Bacteroidota bacterium]